MPFIDQWKTAKTTFESTVKDKKPTQKFLGKFRLGTGIETALKDLDKAKKKDDAAKALGNLDKAATDYCKLLGKEITDPTSVKAVDKPTYTAALEKLKKHLERVKTEAKKMAESLDGQDKKAAVDTKLLQAAQEHLLVQRKAIDSFAKVLQEMVGHESQIKMYHTGAQKSLANFKNPSLAAQSSINSDTVKRFLDESEKLRTETAKKRMDEVFKKHDAASKDLSAVDTVKARLKEIPAATVNEAKKNVEEVAKAKLAVETKYKALQTLCEQIRTMSEEARPVDREALHRAQEHLKLRQRMLTEVTKWSKETPGQLKKLEEFHTRIRYCSAQAKTAVTYQNKTQLQQIENEAAGILNEAKKHVKTCEDLISERTKNGSDLMQARGDRKDDWGKLPPSIGDVIRKQAGEAFGKLDVVQREWQAPINKMDPLVNQMEAILEQIEAANGKTKPASFYLNWLNPAATQLVQDVKTAKTRLEKVVGYSSTFFPKFEGKTVAPKEKELGQKQYEFFKASWDKMNEMVDNHKVLSGRLDGVPSQEVAVTTVIENIRKDIEAVTKINSTYGTEAKKADEKFKKILA